MHIPVHPFAIFSILSALVTLLASFTAWRRSAPGSLMLSLLLLSMAIWSGFYSTRWMDISLEAKTFWFNLMYIGVSALPTLFLLFVLAFTHNDTWFTKRNLLLLSIQPVASIFLQWTNKYHQLFYLSFTEVQEKGFMAVDLVRGPWYFANITYSYVIIIVAFLVLSQVALRSSPLYLNQYRLIMIGSILPWAGSLYSEFNFTAWHGLDLAPLLFGFSGIIFALAILRTHFMDLIPVARTHLIENMPDGVVVLDVQNRIVDINPAMENFIEGKTLSYIGENAFEVFQPWMEKTDLFLAGMETRTELKGPKDPSRYLDLRVTPLYDRGQLLNGRLMVFRDITERKQVEKRLRYVNDRLQTQLIEIGLLQSKLREQAIRDPLTNLFNRRYLEETLDRELSRAARENYPVCVIMIDLDHFKRINDTYGHEAGDLVLKSIADTLSDESRRGDFACRFGGEEFVIAMPNISMETAYERAENLRQSLNSLHVPYESYNLTVTISMGIACYPENGRTRETLLRAADQAMYAAKEAGRDHILSYDQLNISEEALED
ncbi:MAG TPA: diguanylate cyclase [Anaerolineales bacterium]|nr:diguanylate cyclase [Anaerolineales bacterium]